MCLVNHNNIDPLLISIFKYNIRDPCLLSNTYKPTWIEEIIFFQNTTDTTIDIQYDIYFYITCMFPIYIFVMCILLWLYHEPKVVSNMVRGNTII